MCSTLNFIINNSTPPIHTYYKEFHHAFYIENAAKYLLPVIVEILFFFLLQRGRPTVVRVPGPSGDSVWMLTNCCSILLQFKIESDASLVSKSSAVRCCYCCGRILVESWRHHESGQPSWIVYILCISIRVSFLYALKPALVIFSVIQTRRICTFQDPTKRQILNFQA